MEQLKRRARRWIANTQHNRVDTIDTSSQRLFVSEIVTAFAPQLPDSTLN